MVSFQLVNAVVADTLFNIIVDFLSITLSGWLSFDGKQPREIELMLESIRYASGGVYHRRSPTFYTVFYVRTATQRTLEAIPTWPIL